MRLCHRDETFTRVRLRLDRDRVLEVAQHDVDLGRQFAGLGAQLCVVRRNEMDHALQSRRQFEVWARRADRQGFKKLARSFHRENPRWKPLPPLAGEGGRAKRGRMRGIERSEMAPISRCVACGPPPVVDRNQTRLVSTAILPCTALEYGQIPCAAWISASATSRSTPGKLTSRRAERKKAPPSRCRSI